VKFYRHKPRSGATLALSAVKGAGAVSVRAWGRTVSTPTVDLEAGSYVLICNIFDDAENEAHYQEGMRTAFTVE